MPAVPQNVNYEMISRKWFNVCEDFGAIGDGITDDSAAFNNAINALVAEFGGGKLVVPAGTFLIGSTIKMASSVHLVGAGIDATVLLLKAGVNVDLVNFGTVANINLSAAVGTGSTGGAFNFSIQDLTLDGNKANQSGASYCLRGYGYGYIVHNARIRNAFTDGVLVDWNGGAASPGNDSMESHWSNVKIHDCGGTGLRIGGPHDSNFVNLQSFANGQHGIHIAPNGTALQFTNCHVWNIAANQVGWLIYAGYSLFYNC
jgi:hypothetical protein